MSKIFLLRHRKVVQGRSKSTEIVGKVRIHEVRDRRRRIEKPSRIRICRRVTPVRRINAKFVDRLDVFEVLLVPRVLQNIELRLLVLP